MGMRAQPAPQLGRLILVAGPLLLGALVLGRVELLALAAPLLVALTAGLSRRSPAVSAELRLSASRCLEGQRVVAMVRLTAATTAGAADQVDVELLHDPRLRALGPTRVSVRLAPGETRDVTVGFAPSRWGVYDVGPLTLVVHGQGRLSAAWSAQPAVALRVIPMMEDFGAGDAHPFRRALTGSHVSRVAGEGVEFAGVRPYAPGDSLRRVHWRATNRSGDLHVTERLVERNAEVVLMLDTFDEVGPPGSSTLDIAVRAALGIAEHYLGRGDRVGVVTFGGTTRWLTAGTGGVQRHRVVEHLLGVEVGLSYAWKDVGLLPPRCLPPRALVIGLSPLLDLRATTAFADLAGRSYGVVVVDTAPPDLGSHASGGQAVGTAEERSTEYALAERLYRLEREAVLHRLAEVGAPVVPWTGRGGLDAVLTEVSRLHARPRLARR